MNSDQLLSAVRSILSLVAGYAVGRGIVDAEQATLISGAILAVIPFAWGMIAHTKQAKLAAVAAMPQVQTIVTTDVATATAAPSPKVVPAANASL